MKKQPLSGLLCLAVLMAASFWLLFRGVSSATLRQAFSGFRPGYLLLGLGLMLCFVGCEALCSRLTLVRLGHRVAYRRCLGCSFAGFYLSSITPSSSGGQPAQVYYFSRQGVPAAHGALVMLLNAICYQVVSLLLALAACMLLPELLRSLGTGMSLLLAGGGAVMVLLTAGMLCMLLRPGTARRLAGGLLSIGAALRLVRHREAAQTGLERQLAAYRQGAAYIRANRTLLPQLLGITLLQLVAIYAVPYAVYLGFGLRQTTLLELAGAQALLSLAVSALPLPGAVGAAEGGALRIFPLFFPSALAAPAVMAARGISFYSMLLLSGLVTLLLHWRTRHI